jgi:beta-glucosidase
VPGRWRLGRDGVRAGLNRPDGNPAHVDDGSAREAARGPFDLPFVWAVGIEDTFIPQLARRTGRVLDEYELTQHYRFWRDDLDLIASLGVRHIRYGIPWYRINPAPGRFDWTWTDQVVPYIVQTLGIQPIVDLMHYGCPLWLEREFINPAYADRVAEYAGAFAERYGGLVRYYTPLNEPRVNAHFSGSSGVWPPHLRGQRGYVRIMMAIARGMSQTVAAVRSAQRDAVIVHVEAGSHIVAEDRALEPEVARRLEHRFLAAELQLGRVRETHPMWQWLVERGAQTADLEWLVAHPEPIDVDGVNFYPRFSCYRVFGSPEAPQSKPRFGTGDDLGAVLEAQHRRLGLPVMVTETSEAARVAARERWLDESVRGIATVRARGVPVLGYTWFPVFSLIRWQYRRGRKTLAEYITDMGLWDLRDDGTGTLDRRPTRLIEQFRELVRAGDGLPGVEAWPPAGRRNGTIR